MPTISDVAHKAGLSVSTVSRVINKKPHVSPQKEALVKAAMKELGYKPMPAARQLRGSHVKNLAVTVPRITNPFFSDLVNVIERTLDNAGYTTILIQTFGRKDKELAALDLLTNQTVDGVILCSIENEASVIQEYSVFGTIVLVNEYLDELKLPTVRSNQYQGFKKATEFLIQKGYQKIAYVTGHKNIIVTKEEGTNLNSDRFSGFQASLREAGLNFDPQFLYTHIQTKDDGIALFQKIFSEGDMPDAIISGSDEVAVGIMEAARKNGVEIPQQLAVLGIDDQPLSKDLFIPLTTLRQPVEEMGAAAATMLIKNVQDEEINVKKVFDLDLIVRDSV